MEGNAKCSVFFFAIVTSLLFQITNIPNTFEVTTSDGYILSIQRIPGPRKSSKAVTRSKPVVFLMHGLFGSATAWIANLPNQSLAFMAADAGASDDVIADRKKTHSFSCVFIK